MTYIAMIFGCVDQQIQYRSEEPAEIAEGEGYFSPSDMPTVTQFALLSDLQAGDLVITEVMHSPTMSRYDSSENGLRFTTR